MLGASSAAVMEAERTLWKKMLLSLVGALQVREM